MKKKIFEKFQAKSLNKESQKNIVGGDYYSCINACMTANDYPTCEWGAYYPCCASACNEDPERTTFPLCCNPV